MTAASMVASALNASSSTGRGGRRPGPRPRRGRSPYPSGIMRPACRVGDADVAAHRALVVVVPSRSRRRGPRGARPAPPTAASRPGRWTPMSSEPGAPEGEPDERDDDHGQGEPEDQHRLRSRADPQQVVAADRPHGPQHQRVPSRRGSSQRPMPPADGRPEQQHADVREHVDHGARRRRRARRSPGGPSRSA